MNISNLKNLFVTVYLSGCLFVTIYSISYFHYPETTSNESIFLDSATTPHCVDDITTLPIHLMTVKKNGRGYRGTTFLISDDMWMSAAHVTDGSDGSVKIYTGDKILNGKVVYSGGDVSDVAIIKTEKQDTEPLVINYNNPPLLDNIWNVGFPGWAGERQVITSGHIMQELVGEIYTDAMVSGGMSGGPTLSCSGDQVRVVGVIKSYANRHIGDDIVIIDGITRTKKRLVNDGTGYSTLIATIKSNLPLIYVK